MSDLISRQKVMWMLTNLSYTQCKTQGEADVIEIAKTLVITMPSAQSDVPDTNVGDMISRQAAIDAVKHAWAKGLEPTQFIEDLPSAQPERKWTPCSNPPKHHKDVIVRGIEAIGNVTVHKVMQWDVDTWRPMDYAPSIMWKEWSEI